MLQGDRRGGGKSVAWFVLVRVPELLLALLVAVLVVFLTLAVVGRYLFDIGIAWSDELARMLFVWVVFLGFAVGIRHRGNIGVELLVDRLSPPKRRWVVALQDLMVLAFSIFFAWQAVITFKFSLLQRLPVMQVTIGWLYAAVVVASLMMVGYAAANLVDSLRGEAGAHADAAGADAMRRSE
jgi:TRAP-type C4-dicarboxylate transport system permease small subunit